MSASRETIQNERRHDLFDRFRAVRSAIHALDHITEDRTLSFEDRANAIELLIDGIKNAIDGRSTGREFRTLRHSHAAKTDPQHHPVVADADRRCQSCGAVGPKPFSHCYEHRPELPTVDKGDHEVPAPDDANAMIVCVNAGHGLKPVRLLLLHQLYAHVLDQILDQNPGSEQVVCVPIRSENYATVWSRDHKAGMIATPQQDQR